MPNIFLSFLNNYITSVFHWNITIWLVMKWSHDNKRDVLHPNTQTRTGTCLHDDVRCWRICFLLKKKYLKCAYCEVSNLFIYQIYSCPIYWFFFTKCSSYLIHWSILRKIFFNNLIFFFRVIFNIDSLKKICSFKKLKISRFSFQIYSIKPGVWNKINEQCVN
jgi:hypothetical protein